MHDTVKLLEKMRNSPNGWAISDVETLCGQIGMKSKAPTGGSHYKISSPFVGGILIVVARRPIKPVYIRRLVLWADTHIRHQEAGR
jgi:hypothetical protein